VRGYLGNQGRNRPNKGPRHGGGGNRDGNRGNSNGNGGGRPDDMMHEPEMFDADDAEIISPAELTQSRASMNLTDASGNNTRIDDFLLARLIAEDARLPFCKIDPLKLDVEMIESKISRPFARKNKMIPVAIRDGKTAYVNDMPRVLGYLRRAAGRYAELDPLTALLDELHGSATSPVAA